VSVETFQGKPVTLEKRKEIFVTKLHIKRKLILKNEIMGKEK
jgi:hypothetical protein